MRVELSEAQIKQLLRCVRLHEPRLLGSVSAPLQRALDDEERRRKYFEQQRKAQENGARDQTGFYSY